MQIIIAEHSGACFGVRRTIEIAQEAAADTGAYTDGPLIHNTQAVDKLRQDNIIPIEDFADAPRGSKLIIRSHGVPPERLQKAQDYGLTIIDATCPCVRKAQLIAEQLSEEGYLVVIVGEADHPEVNGFVGWAKGRAVVVANTTEALQLAPDSLTKVGVIAQTTQTEENFLQVLAVLQQKAGELRIEPTICLSTKQHQQSALKLAHDVDLMLVIGGKNSSNCRKLAQICKSVLGRVYHIETAAELNTEIIRGAAKIGITAGASTPDWIIKEVVKKMSELEKQLEEITPEEAVSEIVSETENGEPTAALEEALAPQVVAEQAYEQPEQPSDEAEAASAEPEVDSFVAEYGDMREIRRGARVKGVVVQVKPDELLVDIGGKSEGVLAASELTVEDAKNIQERFKVGDEIDVLILRKENQEGYPVLSKRRIDQEAAWDKLIQLKAENQIITGKVTEVVKGGLLVDVGLRGFVPASLVSLNYIEDLSTYINQDLQLKIIDCDKSSNKLVLSAKAVLRKASQEQKEKTWAEIAEGQTRRGTVRRLTNFGAFIDVGGVDGLLHVSEMAWYRVNHPGDILQEGDELDVFVLGVDSDNEKISLGLKQLVANPWSNVQERYPLESIIEAKVMRTTTFGAFLEVEPGVEGLVHISQLAHDRVEKTEDVVKPGDIVQVKVLVIDPEAKRMSLSIKAALPEEEAIANPDAPYGEDIPVGPFEDAEPTTVAEVIEEASEVLAAEDGGTTHEPVTEDQEA